MKFGINWYVVLIMIPLIMAVNYVVDKVTENDMVTKVIFLAAFNVCFIGMLIRDAVETVDHTQVIKERVKKLLKNRK